MSIMMFELYWYKNNQAMHQDIRPELLSFNFCNATATSSHLHFEKQQHACAHTGACLMLEVLMLSLLLKMGI